MSIRSTAKAIIIDQEKVLLIKCCDKNNGEYYALPGGGQNLFETLHDAVVRECLEETGYTVYPVRLAALYEEICDDPEFRETRPDSAHRMYHIFICHLENLGRQQPSETDDMQTGIDWIAVKELGHIRLLPPAVGENLLNLVNSDSPLFLGSEHFPFNHG